MSFGLKAMGWSPVPPTRAGVPAPLEPPGGAEPPRRPTPAGVPGAGGRDVDRERARGDGPAIGGLGVCPTLSEDEQDTVFARAQAETRHARRLGKDEAIGEARGDTVGQRTVVARRYSGSHWH